MIGILIALQINNWNNDRLLSHQINANLTKLASAIEQDYNLLKLMEEFNDFRSNSLLQVLKWTELPIVAFNRTNDLLEQTDIDTIPVKLTSTLIWAKAVPETFNQDFFWQNIYMDSQTSDDYYTILRNEGI